MTSIAPPSEHSLSLPIRAKISRVWLAYLGVALVTVLAYVFAFELWHADASVPPYYFFGGDVMTTLALAKAWLEGGNLYNAPQLAAPLGAATYEFPVFYAAQLPLQTLLGWLTHNVFVTVNLLYLAAFAAAAVATFFALRRLGVPTAIAFAPAVLFALMPRFAAGEGRVDLPVFWIMPLSGLMCVLIARGHTPLFERRRGRLRLTGDGICIVTIAVLTGLGNQYYAFFAVALLGAAAVIAAAKERSPRPLIVSAGLAAIVTLGLVVQGIPTLLYKLHFGRNPTAFIRYPEEAQTYALQIAQLVLPVGGHRGGGWLTAQRAFYDLHAPWATSEASASTLGAIASLGFLAILVALLVRAARKLPYDVEELALLNCAALLLAVPSGFGALFNYYINPDIRAYNRISLFIAFFALAGLAQICMAVGARWKLRLPPAARVAAIAAVIVFGFWDQTSAGWIPPYAASASEFHSDAAFVSAVEARIGAGAAFELPWMRFPESVAIGKLAQGDLYRPYLHAKTLRTTWGAVQGRDPFVWQNTVANLPPPDMIRAAVLGGFDGFIVFRQGYVDNGFALEGKLRTVLGQPIVSPDGTLAFYSTKAIRQRVIAADPEIGTPWFVERTVRTIVPTLGPAFARDFPDPEVNIWHATSPAATILVRNNASRPRPFRLRATVEFAAPAQTVQVAAGAATATVSAAGSHTLDFPFDAPPGKTIVHLTSLGEGPVQTGPRPFVFRLIRPTVTPDDLSAPTPAANAALYAAVAPIAAANDFGGQRMRLIDGCWPLESGNGSHWNWCSKAGTFVVEADRAERVHLSAIIVTPGSPKSRLQLDVDGKGRQLTIVPTGTRLELELDVSPLRPVTIHFSSDARPLQSADVRTLVVQFLEPKLSVK